MTLHVPRLPSQPASTGGRLSDWFNCLELAWQYIAMIRNNLSIIWISLVQRLHTSLYLENCTKNPELFLARKSHGTIQFIPLVLNIASFFRNISFSVSPNVYNFGRENSLQYWNPTIFGLYYIEDCRISAVELNINL